MKKDRILSHVLTAVVSCMLTLVLTMGIFTLTQSGGFSNPASQSETSLPGKKLRRLEKLILDRFIGDADEKSMEDAAAAAMVDSLGDRWSYYLTAEEYLDYQEQTQNVYVGVGITIQETEDGTGFQVLEVVEGGPAEEAGLRAGDVIVRIDGTDCKGMDMSAVRGLVRGEEGTAVTFTVSRANLEQEISVQRRQFDTPVAVGQLLPEGYGLITIANFDEKCYDETKAAIDELLAQGAKGLIFDLRFNPGGYQTELVQILDDLLPEGDLFRAEDYQGRVTVDKSDANCLDLPMAVLVNRDSYSAAEFFAAAIQEYEAGVIVGEQTCGKGYFQNCFELGDGSAVGLSTGKYYTPKGVSLAGVGVTPDVPVEVDDETYAAIYYGTLEPSEDPQIQAAIKALQSANPS